MLYILIVKVFGPWPERWYLLLPLGWGEYHCIVPSAHVLLYAIYRSADCYCCRVIWIEMGAIWNRLCVSHRTRLLYIYSGTYSKFSSPHGWP